MRSPPSVGDVVGPPPEDVGTGFGMHPIDLTLVGTPFLLCLGKPAEDMLDPIATVRKLLAVVRTRNESVKGHAHFDDDFGHYGAPVSPLQGRTGARFSDKLQEI